MLCDKVFFLSTDKKQAELTNNCPYKGVAESHQLLHALDYIDYEHTLFSEIQNIYKITGRYRITDNFNLYLSKSGKERRINIILYLNRDWKEEYGGELQLWNSEFTHCEARIAPKFNSAVIFRTSDISYHGLPTPITCPEGEGRKSIAIYYVSDPHTDIELRYKAYFRPLPDQPVTKELARLYDIRREQIITDEILKEVYPNWEEDGNGYW